MPIPGPYALVHGHVRKKAVDNSQVSEVPGRGLFEGDDNGALESESARRGRDRRERVEGVDVDVDVDVDSDKTKMTSWICKCRKVREDSVLFVWMAELTGLVI